MLKAIHAGEDIAAARQKAVQVIEKLRGLRLTKAADIVETAVDETLAYYTFPEEHWRRIRTNNPLERILREIRRRTRVVGAFPDGQSALNLAAARLRHIAGTAWSTKRYLNIELLKEQTERCHHRVSQFRAPLSLIKCGDLDLRVGAPPARVTPGQIPARARREAVGNEIEARGPERLASQKPRQASSSRRPKAVTLNGFLGIVRAGRQVPAFIADERGKRVAVKPDQPAPGQPRRTAGDVEKIVENRHSFARHPERQRPLE